VSTVDALSDDEGIDMRIRGKKRKRGQQSQYVDEPEDEESEEDFEESEDERATRRRRTRRSEGTSRSLRSKKHPIYAKELEDDDDDSDSVQFLDSDLFGTVKSRGRPKGPPKPDKFARLRAGERQSGRATRHQGAMQEVDETNIYRSDSDEETKPAPKPKAVGAREQFKTLPRNDEFRMRHIQECETCGNGANYAPLIYCQGCTLAYHKACLGPRNSREHLVTKIGEDDSVLQCRRCVAFARKKDPTAPDQGKCSDCHKHGNACQPFRSRKTTAQEQKERDDNEGQDPIYHVDPSRVNQAENVLFRCLSCWRGFHFEHLPSRSDVMDMDSDVDPEQRFREYSRDWKCKECFDMPAKVSGLIAWKPLEEDNYDPGIPFEAIDEDEKAYLVRWEAMSYFRAMWMPGAWVWGVTAHSMRKAFAKREDSQHPKMRTEDAIPEDYLRADIVLDIKYTSYVEIRTEEIDKARIREISKALIKYKGLGYEDAVWEAPPLPEDGERWSDFVMAYNDWIHGRYIKPPKSNSLKSRLDKARKSDFAKLEKKAQPDNVEGGQLMKYQVEGLNWLYYKWFTQKNAILADEMGLGKTIQIIGFLATLVEDWSCYPFLVVVPNSTCPNWRREIKRWAPGLRVVAYYGSRESRDLAYKYELFPENSKDLRCHVVVTSYDAAADDSCRKFFKSVAWQGLVVDEGQRLKNDKGLLYSALSLLKVPFKILLTGTPLQNNARELFNLLHFLDESKNAAELEQEFAELDSEKITQLHDMIRPFFLRRTKAQVLTFLPPMAQIIVPVSMTIVQKKLYRTILAKNPDLMKAIFSAEAPLKVAERASLSNILMQLRKCLCHPFVYNNSIEERNVSHAASHRNLVDASAKIKLLELLLPKLKERGHRVLIFSQFLDMLDIVEDFLDGMELAYQRLDGRISALQKQKRIDEFNAPESPLFAFLLSTRAGGVGINLATADTVIILDPDFNPHQDIQALSRAHRIGQHKKVLCFQLITRSSAEERIMQMGRKKLALDHVLIQEMDADDADQNDLVSILRHGAAELFEDSGDQDIVYDGVSVDRLLDRSHIEDTKAGEDKSAETQFSRARIWANDTGALQDEMLDEVDEAEQQAPNPGVWANILKERERVAAEEAAAKADAYGRGRRARLNVDYNNETGMEAIDGVDLTPNKPKKAKRFNGDESDTDFQADESDAADEDGDEDGEFDMDEEKKGEDDEPVTKRETGKPNGKQTTSHTPNKKPAAPTTTATPKKATPAKVKSTPASSKPKVSGVVSKTETEIVMKPVPRKDRGQMPKVKAATKASTSTAKKASSGKVKAENKSKSPGVKTSASAMKKSAIQSNGAPAVQPFNKTGTAAEPIYLDSSDDEDPVAASRTHAHPAPPPPPETKDPDPVNSS
jgi:chromodomain-helicase-DNA-binding protein 4